YDIDDLERVVARNRGARAREADKAETIVDTEVEAFWRWFTSLDVVPTIVALRERVEVIRRREVERGLAALGAVDPQQREAIERLTQAIVNKVLHAPLTALRRHRAEPAGLVVGAVPARAAAHDVLIGAGGLRELPSGTRVGTASVRRRAQLLARRRDVVVTPLRGNVDTRLRRWREGAVDALILAAAGLERLGIAEPAALALAPEEFLPPVGQGALALECRADAPATRALLAAVEDPAAATAVAAERAFLLAIGGDCNTPLAAHATVADGQVALRALVTDREGQHWLGDAGSAPAAAARGRRRCAARAYRSRSSPACRPPSRCRPTPASRSRTATMPRWSPSRPGTRRAWATRWCRPRCPGRRSRATAARSSSSWACGRCPRSWRRSSRTGSPPTPRPPRFRAARRAHRLPWSRAPRRWPRGCARRGSWR